MFKVNNKDTITIPFTSCSSVSINFVQVNAGWDVFSHEPVIYFHENQTFWQCENMVQNLKNWILSSCGAETITWYEASLHVHDIFLLSMEG